MKDIKIMTNAANTNTAASNENNSDRGEFRPIFTATIVPGAIVRGTTTNGKNAGTAFATMKNSTYATAKRTEAKPVTLMAFGNQLAEVDNALVEGKPVELAVQFDNGTLKVIGFPRAKAA